ncbi:MoxR family ATPase [uncultured Gimesia sp.]|uniref:AAA family ATPase n=1 Tax=uncultured Gimesia sp. TaxID=1678688 RepID=UPI000E8CC6AF|nr:ATPase [Planctomycetaceae bacterium]|tara:strand:+ start:2106 stop:3146 length:1041 start_codon:yes stop_codon:yes gene_type:complete
MNISAASHTESSDDVLKNARFIQDVRNQVATVVVGQDEVVERLLISLFTGGHILLQGVPGLAKTLLVSVLSKSIDLDFSRIQFTIDLLPSDILGSQILDQKTNEFVTRTGPVFTNLLLADEINRAAPKVQGALLEAMQERKVTIGNETMSLPAPFLVIATQNPVEQAGTFELPEAQLDRFMLCHRLDYPDPSEEREVLKRNMALGIRKEDRGAVVNTEFDVMKHKPVGSSEDLVNCMQAVNEIHVSDTFLEHVIEVINRTRNHPNIELGCSPRGGIALIKASRARALINGRNYVIPEDLFVLAEDVILHRIRLNYEALADGLTGKAVLQDMLRDLGATPSLISREV